MCAMALVHSRISRVYFLRKSPDGGLISAGVQIGSLKGLNHSYLAFRLVVRSSLAAEPGAVGQPASTSERDDP